MTLVIVGGVLLSLAVSSGSPSQAKPDFSGTWILVASRTPQTLKLKQDPVSLTAEDSEHSVRYRLDGVETRSRPNAEVEVVSQASWQGDRLAIVNTFYVEGQRRSEHRQLWSLDSEGRLVIEVTRQAQGQPATATKTIYKRSSPVVENPRTPEPRNPLSIDQPRERLFDNRVNLR